ncbi:tyrosine-protein phosphatase [Bifidobacterium sp. ESL0763]|uniref:tyrosine-protein phosphatase n=1 Tax=Bifidobacterium sp. ESL0763 TaxID=2983227 RepID=UPI0023F740CB|nr:tyrosine-protein phosphatase [Bifidobacterium sp. ESL0763]MDF7663925.1 tyrosine-protein phosphatase [Bifidobacterium sp. ESL0763]
MNLTNFRDLGGMRNRNGQKIREHLVLRSGQPVGLDEESKRELVDTYHLSEIIDFRRPKEIDGQPDDELEGVKWISLDLLGMVHAVDVSLDDFAAFGQKSKVDDHMLNTYHQMVLEPGAQKGFGHFLDLVLDNETGSTLFHCFAGKDRTGLAAAFILWLLDVDNDQVFADFMKTNGERVKENNSLIEQFRAKGYDQDSLDALSVALYVKEDYLVYALKLINDEYGDIYTYADKALGFGPDKVKALRAKLLED